jgi:MFS family permease
MVNLGSMSSAAVFGRIEAAFGPRRTFASSLAIGALGLLLIGVGPSAWVVGAGSFLSGIAIGLYFPYLWLVAATLPSPELRSKVLALQASAMYLGGFLYPAIFGGLSRGFGLEGAFVAMAAFMSVATAAVLLARSGRLLLVRAPS